MFARILVEIDFGYDLIYELISYRARVSYEIKVAYEELPKH